MLSKTLKEGGEKRTLKTMVIYIGKPVTGWQEDFVFWKQGIITLAHVSQLFL